MVVGLVSFLGRDINSADNFAPIMYAAAMNMVNTTVTVNWATNENSTSKVFYSVNPVTINEGDINSVGFGVINGNTAFGSNYAGTSQQVIISGLQPNTRYYYMLVSTDVNGNVSVSYVNNTFITSN